MVGIKHLKPDVLACGERASVASGGRIDIKFFIEGRTGAVQSAELLSPMKPTLATCIAEVMAAAGPAVFPRFATEKQGFEFRFRMP